MKYLYKESIPAKTGFYKVYNDQGRCFLAFWSLNGVNPYFMIGPCIQKLSGAIFYPSESKVIHEWEPILDEEKFQEM